ncbi:MAG: 23S rRNA (uracil(1939)-C(5))-methyltransferase RlmD [Oxalobacter sp.]|nr:23S rRNA (uracil(1939)-C(5))-methyltransferase RlmD [Oxalobacter sp.]
MATRTTHTIQIHALDAEGRGVGYLPDESGDASGKVVFVEGALPKETVAAESWKKKSRWELATAVSILKASPLRVSPKCLYFGKCGGCSMQHLEPSAQVAVKQRVLEDNLQHIGKVKAESILPPIHGPYWGYRFRARLSVNHVPKKGGILVGFREKQSRYITDMTQCPVLPPHMSALLVPLRELIGSLSIYSQVPQIEVAIGHDGNRPVTALLLRIMATLSQDDETRLKQFADKHDVQWWLQTKGPDTVHLFYPLENRLQYVLPEFGVTMPFKPGDFTQVNYHINQVLVSRALRLLGIQPDDRVADLFCGLGNFSLPIARRAKEVVGIEGSAVLTRRAQENAILNGLQDKTTFRERNLFEMTVEEWKTLKPFDRILIDPPRDGAMALCQTLADIPDEDARYRPERIVYVSCNPATLARDASILVNSGRYRLLQAGVVNMFPHTSHVESMAVFEVTPEKCKC